MIPNQLITLKHTRLNYGGLNFQATGCLGIKIFEEIEHEKAIRINKRSSPFKPVLLRYPVI